MLKRGVVSRRKNRLCIEALEPRRLLDVTGVWQELGFRSASGGGITYHPYWLEDNFYKSEINGSGNHAIAVDPEGRPIVAHVKIDQRPDPDVLWIGVEQFNGFRWIALGGDALQTIGSGIDPTIAVDFQGRPYVAWVGVDAQEPTALKYGDIYVKYFDGLVWQSLGNSGYLGGISNPGVKNREPDIAIGADGLPIVAYTEYDPTGNDMEIVVKKWDGNQWIELTNGLPIGTTQGTVSNRYGGGVSNDIFDSRNPSITVDRSGYPIVAWTSQSFYNNSEIYVRQWTGSEWKEVGTDSASGPPGKYGPEDTRPSRGISRDDTMSVEPIVRVDNENTIVVAWIDFQDYLNWTNAGIYLKKYEQSASSPSWVEYSPGSATDHGIILGPYWTFENLSMEIGPHSTDPSGLWTPALTWTAANPLFGANTEPYVARYNPGSLQWEFLVGDGEDPRVTEPLDGPHTWFEFVVAGVTPDATGWRKIASYLPSIAIDPTTGHEILTYSHRKITFPDWEIYVQQYRSNTDYYEIRDLDELLTDVDISIAWSDDPGTPTGELTVSILDGNGSPLRVSVNGQIENAAPEAYVDPVAGNTRGLLRLKVEGNPWGKRNYILTVDQGGATQIVTESEPNDTFLTRQGVPSSSGNQEARTVQIGTAADVEQAWVNNEWIELGRGSLTRGGLDNSPTDSVAPVMTTSYDGRPIMAYIDSNRRGDAWLEVKIYDEQARDEYGQPGAWVNLTKNVPLMSSVIDGALSYAPRGVTDPTSGAVESRVQVMDISYDPWILNDLSGKVFLAVTDGTYIDVYSTEYDPVAGTYSDFVLVGGNHAVTAPAGGKITWVAIQSGPNGEAALAWEWYTKDGFPARNAFDYSDFYEIRDLDDTLQATITMDWVSPTSTAPRVFRLWVKDPDLDWIPYAIYINQTATEFPLPYGTEDVRGAFYIEVVQHDSGGPYTLTINQGGNTYTVNEREPNYIRVIENQGQRTVELVPQVIASDTGLEEARTVEILSDFDYPRLGSADVYLRLWTGTSWVEMGTESSTAPDEYGVGGYTKTGFGRWPDLVFAPSPADPPGTGQNLGGVYYLTWSSGNWDPTAGEQESDPFYFTGFMSYGISASWFDKNTQTWNDAVVDAAGPYTLWNWNKPSPPIGTYQAQRKWPSITIGESGRPFITWTLELYTFGVQDFSKDDPNAGHYNYLGSWIEGWQAGPQPSLWYPLVGGIGHNWEVGTSVSHNGIEAQRASGQERTDDVWMAKTVGNAGQMPIVTWQVLDVDVTVTNDDPGFTYIPHNHMSSQVMGEDGEDVQYDVSRPQKEAGWLCSVREQRQIFARRYNESEGTWEQISSQSASPDMAQFNSAEGDGFQGVDQWWSSGFWPAIALVTNPEVGFPANEPVIAWLNDSEQTVYVRGWHHPANMSILSVAENSGTPNDNVLTFGTVHVGSASTWVPVTIANVGNADLQLVKFNINRPFEIRLTSQQQQQLAAGGITLRLGEQIVVYVRFAPGSDEPGLFTDVMEILSTDPLRPSYVVGLYGTASTGAMLMVTENQGLENDMVLPFGFAQPGQQRSVTFTISNPAAATDPLVIEAIFAGLPALFEIDPVVDPEHPLSILPGQSREITVTFKPQDNLPVFDTLAIYSNDVATPRKFLKLIGNAPALLDVHGTRQTPTTSEVYPAISSDYVAYVRTTEYSEATEPDGDIYVFNRSTGTERTAPIGTGHDPHVWGDWVIFSRGLYDLINNRFYSFSSMPGLGVTSVNHVSVSGNRFAVSTGQQILIFQIDRNKLRADGGWGQGVGTGRVVQQVWTIPTVISGATNDYPALWGDWVAWRVAPTSGAREATDKAVFLYHYGIQNPPDAIRLTPVQGAPGYMIPRFDNARVVWMDDRWGAENPQIFLFDVDRQKGYQLTNSVGDKAAGFAFSGNLIVWADKRSGNWDLYAFDLGLWETDPVRAREAQLTFDEPTALVKYNQFNPSINGAWIAYQDDRPGANQWDVYYGLFPSPPNIGVRELSGVAANDDILDLGNVNVGVAGGVGFEIHNTGYDTLVVSGYQFNNLAGYTSQFKLYRYDDANNNLRKDPGETVYDSDWEPGEALPDLDVGEHHSIWLEWTPTSVTSLPTNAGMTIFSNADLTPEYNLQIKGQGVMTPELVVTPDPVDLGEIPVGASVLYEVTITNTGNVDSTIDRIESTGFPYWVVVPPTEGYPIVIPAHGGTATFRILFVAPLPGTYSATINLYDDPNWQEAGRFYTLTVQARAVLVPDIAVRDAQGGVLTGLSFGDVELNHSQDVVVRIYNEGQAPLTLTGTESSHPSDLFVVGSLPTSPIAPGGWVNVTIRFRPTQVGDFSGAWIRFLSNDPDTAGNLWGAPVESPYTLTVLAGQGIVLPHLVIEERAGTVNDNKIDFGIVVASAGQVDLAFKIRNTGTAPLNVTGWNLTGSPEFSVLNLPPTFVLNPGQEREAIIRFTVSTRGDYAATLRLLSNDADYPPPGYGLAMEAKVRAGQVGTTPNLLEFGNVEVGTGVATRKFRITNTGQAPLTITSVSSSNAAFTITRPSDPRFAGTFVLAVGETTPEFTVTFRPTEVRDYAGSVVISSDDPDAPTRSLPLRGKGVVIPDLTVLESSGTPNDGNIGLGTVKVGQTATQQFTLRNDGSGPLRLISWTSSNAAFTLLPSNGSGSTDDIVLTPGASITVTITFAPLSAVPYTGVISIVSDDPDESPFQIQVSGQGSPATVAGDFDGNGRLDMGDFDLFKGAFGSRAGDPKYDVKYDLDANGVVNFGDLGIFLGYYSQSSRAPGKAIVAGAVVSAEESESTPSAQASGGTDQRTGGTGKTTASAKWGQQVRSAAPSSDEVEVYDGLAVISDLNAVPTATVGTDERADTGTERTDGTATTTTVTSSPEIELIAAAANDRTARWVWSQPTTAFAVASSPTDSEAGRLSLTDLGQIDPLVAPYASALLPSLDRV